MLKVLTKREGIILYLTVGVFIFAVGFKFIIAPILKKNSLLNKEIIFARVKLRKYLWLLSQRDYIKSKYAKFASSGNISAEQLDSLAGVLAELEEIAKNANIRIMDIRPQGPKLSDSYQEFNIDLRAEGAMEGYLNFIYHLENSPALLRIRKFQLSSKANSAVLEGSFSITRFSPS